MDEADRTRFGEYLGSLNADSKNNPSFEFKCDDFSKEKRGKFHETLRQHFSFLNSETKESAAGRSIRVSFSRRPQNSVLSFVLRKRNWDTMQAVNKIARALKRRAGDFFFAGTKDKRAETTQLITAKGVSAKELAGLLHVSSWNFDEVSFSHLEYVQAPLKVGDLLGNRFTLAIRFPERVEEAQVLGNVQRAAQSGFVNYFGLQRFGNSNQVP